MIKNQLLVKNYVAPYDLQRRKGENFLYLSACKGLFEKLIGYKSPFTVSFTDKDGIILFIMGNEKDPFIEEGLIISSLGKTAIGLCLSNGESLEVQGKEHDHPALKNWSCAASPVKDKNRVLVGAISVSALSPNYPSFAFSIASLIASAIEKEANLKTILGEVDFLYKYSQIIAEENKDGVLVLDKDARVLYINSSGADILKVDRDVALGKNVSGIVDFTPVILNVFKTHKGYVDKEFIIESPSRGILHFIKTAVVLKDSDGNFAGVVDFFREIKRVRKFVTSYIGAEAKFTFSDIKGESSKLKEAMRLAKIASNSSSPVLITGETGTGKEMFAQAIHFASSRSDGPFVALNCGAIPRDLAESEFFGYEGGAFTDADKRGRPGKFELADGGTLFLDEIEELPPSIQTKLLRIIEDKVITRVGGTKSLKVDVRIMAATNKNIEELVEKGMFRKDLYYRLNVLKINLPPLRDRREDIPILLKYFIERFNNMLDKNIKGYDESFIDPLLSYSFPGNVRELQNIVERAMNIAEGTLLKRECLPDTIVSSNKCEKRNYDLNILKEEFVKEVLSETGFNIAKASKKIGISRPTLYKLIKKFKIVE
jgi:transcriptional regulator with PAS, ATPase and Fis domain